MQEKKTKDLIKEVIKELNINKTYQIDDLSEDRKTNTIRVYEVTKERLKMHCDKKVYSPSQFASIAIEEKIKSEINDSEQNQEDTD